MSTGPRTVRAGVVMAAATALLLSGCGQQQEEPQAMNTAPAAATSTPKPAKPAAAAAAEPAAAARASAPPGQARAESAAEIPVENVPTELPPGDPGLEAPSVPDPGKPEHDRHHEEPARTEVPAEALLDAATVSGVLGGSWQQTESQPAECAAVTGAVAQRTVSFEADGGRLLLTVATHRSLAAADRAVAEIAGRLQACGWTGRPDPRLGTASAAATSVDDAHTAAVISAEGVTVTLVGSGTATSERARWSSLLDLALGSSCPAAPEGCH
ncbi:MAG: hypothetical protein M3165_05280 [Actinomycetota bacterium]|nr:hypothetical protein [Actinomycetota bacterium]